MRDPARGARNRKHYREHGTRNPDCAVDDSRIEIDVWIQLTGYEVFVVERDLLESQRQLEQRVVALAQFIEHPVAHAADDLGARIEVLVNPMAKSHQTDAIGLVFDSCQKLVDIRSRTDVVQHGSYRLVGSAVSR